MGQMISVSFLGSVDSQLGRDNDSRAKRRWFRLEERFSDGRVVAKKVGDRKLMLPIPDRPTTHATDQ